MSDSSRLQRSLVLPTLCAIVTVFASSFCAAQTQKIPEVLQPWEDWVTWDVKHRDCPRVFNNADQAICFWPSRLDFAADQNGATWDIAVDVFEATWVPLPGTPKMWPVDVRVGEQAAAVVERDGRPAVKLERGSQQLTGAFRWDAMPQRIAIPPAIGILKLTVDGSEIPVPNWDAKGEVWLRRIQGEAADKDLLNLQVYRVIEDGIPIWLHTDIELTVSGKSREEQLGWILPEGWQIATVESQIPIAIDDRGVIKAQVRAGKWVVSVHAFRTTDPGEVRFVEGASPLSQTELVGLQTDASFRVSQIEGLATVDVTQTTYPEKWRRYPVYQWDTGETFRLVEKMRGMGDRRPEGLRIDRRLWLDEDGNGLTYRDQLRGNMQRIWRLDVAEGYELGAVRIDGDGQLITSNPDSAVSGVEIRSRNLNMEAIGHVDRTSEINANGWQTDAESLELTLTLPPGWRVFAVFGADRVEGDWLTAWSLLDLFLLLIFSLAVFRMYGWIAGITALIAFGLAYHEIGAPRLTWLFLLMPLALLRVIDSGSGRKWILAWKYAAITSLLLCFIPFVATQLQGVIYPQLERSGISYGDRSFFGLPTAHYYAAMQSTQALKEETRVSKNNMKQIGLALPSNLLFDPKSKIQTGPAEPTWNWNDVRCVWNGPVKSQQTIQPILISLTLHRVLTITRLALLLLLAAILLRGEKIPFRFLRRGAAAVALLLVMSCPASGQIPDQEVLKTLRERLLETSDAFPNAAEIPEVGLTLNGSEIEMKVRVHAATDVAVPLPGRLPSWSPVSITMDDSEGNVLVSRRDGYLWVLVKGGVHEVTVKGLLSDEADWVWTFLLPPKYVNIDASGWNVTGVNSDGIPDSQVFFSPVQAAEGDSAAYDRTDFNPIVIVDRYLEIGLLSKVHNKVTRLSQVGKAVALDIPLLPNESVLTSNRTVNGNTIAVRLGPQQESLEWDSELPMGAELQLNSAQTDRWVERWHLVTSPVWNVALSGLEPVFESGQTDLVPIWHPWPGESVTMAFSRPVAVRGDTMTVRQVRQEISLGQRLQTTTLQVELECSLASDFVIQIDADAEVASLTLDQQPVPVQRDGEQLIVSARPGKQNISATWKTSDRLTSVVRSGSVILPADASNSTTVMRMPENRWVLWASGPLRGPAVRFWTILSVAILAALALGSVPLSPLRRWEWVLLAIGLTQVHLVPAMVVVGWLFLLAWRGSDNVEGNAIRFNLRQVLIVFTTVVSLIILMFTVSAGLLGSPDMFIVGNGSSRTYLQWFQPQSGPELPKASVLSVSVWFYRLLMLCWALWLATALLRWLKWGWEQFSHGETWRTMVKPILAERVDPAAGKEAGQQEQGPQQESGPQLEPGG